MVKDEEGKDGGDGSTGNVDSPEQPLASDLVQSHLVDEDSNPETSPSGKESSSNSLKLHHEESGDESDQDRTNEDCPGNPVLSGTLQEGGVEQEQNGASDKQGSDEEDGSLEEDSSKEANEGSGHDQNGGPQPRVVVKEVPDVAEVQCWASLFALECGHPLIISLGNKVTNDWSVDVVVTDHLNSEC